MNTDGFNEAELSKIISSKLAELEVFEGAEKALNDIKRLRQYKSELEMSVESLKNESKEILAKNDECKASLDQALKRERENMERENDDAKKEIVAAKQEAGDIRAAAANDARALLETNKAQADEVLKRANDRASELQEGIKVLESEHEKLEKSVAEKRADLVNIEAEIDKLQSLAARVIKGK